MGNKAIIATLKNMRHHIFLALAFAASSLQSTAQTASAPTVPDPHMTQIFSLLDKTRSPRAAALSPDGTSLAWTQMGQLHLAATAALTQDKTIAPPAEGCSLNEPVWSADSSQLAYLSECHGETYPSLYVLDNATQKSRKLAALQGNIESMRWAPNGQSIAFLYVPHATRSAGALDAMKPAIGVIGRDNFEVQTVSQIELKSGLLTQITPQGLYAYEFSWAPDSKQIVFSGATPPGENNWWVAKLYLTAVYSSTQAAGRVCPNETGCATVLVDPTSIEGPLHKMQIAVPRFSPDGQNIAFIGGLMSDFGATGGDLYIVKASGVQAGKDTHPFTEGRKASISWFQWTDNDHVLISEVERGGVHLAVLGTSGEQMPWFSQTINGNVSSGESSLSLSASVKTRSVAMIISSFTQAPELWYGTPNHLTQVTHLNDSLKPFWGRTESVEYTNDSFQVQGFVVLPANYDPSKKYPIVTVVHGGPASSYLPSWGRGGSFSPAAFSAMGYFVFLPNPRGSFGQGEAFTQANRKDFGYGDLRDILTGLDVLEKQYSIDPQREGIAGWSYGGFMTMFSVTKTHRFHAAVAGAGISNWQSYYGENSIDEWMIPYFGDSVYNDPAVYAKSSAINYIQQTKTPTLILVGDRDGECPAPQSFEFWHALRAQKIPTELVVYPNEGHGFRNPEHRLDVLTRSLEWFNQYMPAN